jgi:hypothetical protein
MFFKNYCSIFGTKVRLIFHFFHLNLNNKGTLFVFFNKILTNSLRYVYFRKFTQAFY